MPKGITIQEAAQRLSDAGSRLTDRYLRGTSGKGQKWFQAASGATANFKAGISDPNIDKRWASGVSEAGASGYDQGVLNKGLNNWGTGLATAGDKYSRKVAKAATLWNQPLQAPKGPRRSASNQQRMVENYNRFKGLRA